MNDRSGFGALAIVVFIALVAAIGGFSFYTLRADSEDADVRASAEAAPKLAVVPDDAVLIATTTSAYRGAMLAGNPASGSALLDFVKSDYDAALTAGKLIVLYFYADWDSVAKDEVANALIPAFNAPKTDAADVIGFRVNFDDTKTDADEEALAREFGVTYQRAKVFVEGGERVLKAPEPWKTERYTSEIAKALGR